jgi:diacylglycerol kinase (ATP)
LEAFSLAARLRSMGHAVRGIGVLLRTQHNAWVHLLATALVLGMGLAFDIASSEWQMIVLAGVAVWTAEALNTALEFLCDLASPEFHPLAKQAKDAAAGAVLISAIGAAAIGLMIFGPRLLAVIG